MKAEWDIHEIVKQMLGGARAQERGELTAIIRKSMRDDPAMKQFVIEICDHCEKAGSSPVQAIAQGIQYGIVMGIWLEQERAARPRIIQ